MNVQNGRIDVPTATGNLSVTGLGFRPTLVLFFANDSNHNSQAMYALGFMCDDGVNASAQFALSYSEEGTDPSNVMSTESESRCAIWGDDTWNNKWELSYVSMDADGFTVNVDDGRAAFGTHRCYWIAMDPPNVEAAFRSMQATNGNTDTQSFAFAPDAIIVMGYEVGTVSQQADNHVSLGWAVGTGADDQAVMAGHSDDAFTPYRNSCDLLRSGRVLARVTDTDTSDGQWSVTGFGTSSVQFTCQESSGNAPNAAIIAIGGVSAAAGIRTSPTAGTSGDQESVTGVGFQPQAMMLMNVSKPASTSVRSGQHFDVSWVAPPVSISGGSLGPSWNLNLNGYLEGSNGEALEVIVNNQAMNMARGKTDDIQAEIDEDTGQGSLDPDGFTIQWEWSGSPPAVAYEYAWLALGGNPALSGAVSFAGMREQGSRHRSLAA